ncbi:MAG TPA: SRPBCC domain-containing protein [Burkholderiales bacterium]|nr:SRPBCC domain-containing protein [Burkholderiales bacterium]
MANTKTQERPSLSIVRKLDAAPGEVWRAITEPEMLKRWMAPSDDFKIPVAEAELRVGGRYHIIMNAPDGQVHDVSGVYREIVPNKKLVYTWAWKSTPERESVVTIELRAAGGGTELTLKHEQFADAEARDRHQQGWMGCLARLESAVA